MAFVPDFFTFFVPSGLIFTSHVSDRHYNSDHTLIKLSLESESIYTSAFYPNFIDLVIKPSMIQNIIHFHMKVFIN